MTYDTKGVWRCFEIKVSKSDFHSKSKHTFLGHYNYYVMPKELYEQVRHGIPNHIGIYVNGNCVKRAKKQVLQINEQILKDSLIRSLYREWEKQYKSGIPSVVESLKRQISQYKRLADEYKEKYWDLMRIGQEKYGSRWYKEG